ncbi:MAG TPA: hypothetical protein VFY71_04915 [Planctomycetota bacterium]|nr:hypothetical protein [Planctomycetota bacterium]
MKPALLFLALLSAPLAAQSGDDDVFVPFDHVELLSSGFAHVTLDGSVTLAAPVSTIGVTQSGSGAVKGVTAAITMQGSVTLEVSAEASGSVSETLPLAAVPLQAFTAGSGVDVEPWAVVSVTVTGCAAAGLRTSWVQAFTLEASVAVGPGFHVTATEGPAVQLAGEPDIAAGGAADIHVSTTVAVVYLLAKGGLPLGGPLAGITMDVDSHVDTAADPWWSVDGQSTLLAGYFGLGIAPLVFPQAPVNLGAADGPAPPGAPTSRWAVTLDTGGIEGAKGLLATQDGYLVTALHDLADPFLARLGPDGALLSADIASTITSGGGEQVICSEPTLDGGVLLGGNGAGGLRLDRLDAGGTMVWSKVFSHDGAILPAFIDVVAMDDGGFACLGRMILASTSIARAFVMRLDADGQVLWVRDLFLGGTDPGVQPHDLAPTADGGVVLTGGCSYFESFVGTPVLSVNNLLLARLDADGDLVFAEVLGTTSGEEGRCVTEGLNGTLWVGGALTEGPSTYAWVSSFAANGGLGSTIKLHGNDPTSIFTNSVHTVVPTSLGLQLFGERGLGTGRDAWLALIASNGLPMTWTTIGGPGDDAPLGLRLVPFGMIAWGSTSSPDALGSGTGTDQWLLHTSVDGVLHFKPSTGFTTTSEKVDWGFPVGNLVFATLLAPSVQSATMTVTDKPLPFTATTAAETVLTE